MKKHGIIFCLFFSFLVEASSGNIQDDFQVDVTSGLSLQILQDSLSKDKAIISSLKCKVHDLQKIDDAMRDIDAIVPLYPPYLASLQEDKRQNKILEQEWEFFRCQSQQRYHLYKDQSIESMIYHWSLIPPALRQSSLFPPQFHMPLNRLSSLKSDIQTLSSASLTPSDQWFDLQFYQQTSGQGKQHVYSIETYKQDLINDFLQTKQVFAAMLASKYQDPLVLSCAAACQDAQAQIQQLCIDYAQMDKDEVAGELELHDYLIMREKMDGYKHKLNQAFVTIQSLARGVQARSQLHALKEKKRHDIAALVLQKHVRGFIARQHYVQNLLQSKKEHVVQKELMPGVEPKDGQEQIVYQRNKIEHKQVQEQKLKDKLEFMHKQSPLLVKDFFELVMLQAKHDAQVKKAQERQLQKQAQTQQKEELRLMENEDKNAQKIRKVEAKKLALQKKQEEEKKKNLEKIRVQNERDKQYVVHAILDDLVDQALEQIQVTVAAREVANRDVVHEDACAQLTEQDDRVVIQQTLGNDNENVQESKTLYQAFVEEIESLSGRKAALEQAVRDAQIKMEQATTSKKKEKRKRQLEAQCTALNKFQEEVGYVVVQDALRKFVDIVDGVCHNDNIDFITMFAVSFYKDQLIKIFGHLTQSGKRLSWFLYLDEELKAKAKKGCDCMRQKLAQYEKVRLNAGEEQKQCFRKVEDLMHTHFELHKDFMDVEQEVCQGVSLDQVIQKKTSNPGLLREINASAEKLKKYPKYVHWLGIKRIGVIMSVLYGPGGILNTQGADYEIDFKECILPPQVIYNSFDELYKLYQGHDNKENLETIARQVCDIFAQINLSEYYVLELSRYLLGLSKDLAYLSYGGALDYDQLRYHFYDKTMKENRERNLGYNQAQINDCVNIQMECIQFFIHAVRNN